MSELDYRNWSLEDADDARLEYISILLSRSNDTEEIAFLRNLQAEMRVAVQKKHAALVKGGKKRVWLF